jgi:hypothetical protein
MATLEQTGTGQHQNVEQSIQQLRQLYADAPEMAKVALEHALPALKSQALDAKASQTESAGRIGTRLGSIPAELSGCARYCGC